MYSNGQTPGCPRCLPNGPWARTISNSQESPTAPAQRKTLSLSKGLVSLASRPWTVYSVLATEGLALLHLHGSYFVGLLPQLQRRFKFLHLAFDKHSIRNTLEVALYVLDIVGARDPLMLELFLAPLGSGPDFRLCIDSCLDLSLPNCSERHHPYGKVVVLSRLSGQAPTLRRNRWG
jgi:hypothetical protein